jgi:hypothetical protein
MTNVQFTAKGEYTYIFESGTAAEYLYGCTCAKVQLCFRPKKLLQPMLTPVQLKCVALLEERKGRKEPAPIVHSIQEAKDRKLAIMALGRNRVDKRKRIGGN